MSTVPLLDEDCGANFSYRDFVECGETFATLEPNNVPKQQRTYAALQELAREILDPVWNEFGKIELTYGISCQALYRHIKARISPNLDQHASYELNAAGNQICNRGGAAVDFYCPAADALNVAQWIVIHCPFDRLYFYGLKRPIHISIGPDESRRVVLMRESNKMHRRIPRNTSIEEFIGLKQDDDLVRSCTVKPGESL